MITVKEVLNCSGVTLSSSANMQNTTAIIIVRILFTHKRGCLDIEGSPTLCNILYHKNCYLSSVFLHFVKIDIKIYVANKVMG